VTDTCRSAVFVNSNATLTAAIGLYHHRLVVRARDLRALGRRRNYQRADGQAFQQLDVMNAS
jgi:hypothetical protein